MSQNWKTYKLGSLLKEKGYIRGPFGSALKRGEMTATGVPVYEQQQAIYNTRDFRFFIGPEKFEKLKRFQVKTNDLIISCSGTVGRVSIINDNDPKGVISQALLILRPDETKVLPYYLKKFFESPEGFNKLLGASYGSVQANIANRNIVENIVLSLPPLPEQTAIASILSAIDDKIELNLQMNKTLEEMAMALYKHWFVDFGPFKDGEFVESELGMIPKGWEVSDFRHLLDLIKDGSHNPPKRVEHGIRFIAGATDIKNLEVTFNKCSYITIEDYLKLHKIWEIKAGDVLMTIVGTIGNTAIVQQKDIPFSMQRSIAIFRPKEYIPNYFIYLIINSSSFKEYVNAHTNPTGQPGIYLKILGNYKSILPSISVLKEFNKKVEDLYLKMFNNLNENQVLTEQRDSLLPKLISGEIKILNT